MSKKQYTWVEITMYSLEEYHVPYHYSPESFDDWKAIFKLITNNSGNGVEVGFSLYPSPMPRKQYYGCTVRMLPLPLSLKSKSLLLLDQIRN